MGTNAIRAVLRCGQPPPGIAWSDLLLDRRVGGVALLRRHLLAFRDAGIEEVCLAVSGADPGEFDRLLHAPRPAGVSLSVVPEAAETDQQLDVRSAVLEQRADVLVDPRLVAQLAKLAAAYPADLVCLDGRAGSEPQAKSPYAVGVAEADEAKPVDAETARRRGLVPIGLALRQGVGGVPGGLDIGRYYWHRFTGPEDVAPATSKVLLATVKATDGVYALNNRRASLRISRLLLDTRVTPNAVTVATLVCGIIAGWLLSRGHYAWLVAGSLMAWFASMLDGVDGELARAKFQSSPFGHWLEMACDYVFYVAVFVGLGLGLHHVSGDTRWLVMGIASGIGAVASFVAVARLKRSYARQGAIGDFYLAFARTVGAPGSNPLLRATPHLTAFMTRAVFPYFLVIFTLLGLAKVALVLMFVATQSFWIVALVVSRVRVNPLQENLPVDPEIQAE